MKSEGQVGELIAVFARGIYKFRDAIRGEVANKLIKSEELVRRLLVEEAPKLFLSVSAAQVSHPIWKTIQLGLHQSADEYRKAIKVAGMKIGDYANDLLNKPAFATSLMPKKCEVKLVKKTVAELGFPNGATLQEIYDRAKEQGLDLCPAEVGPALRLAYQDQPNGEWLRVAMEPIIDSGGGLGVFSVERDGVARWLGTYYSNPEGRWGPGGQWVFLCK